MCFGRLFRFILWVSPNLSVPLSHESIWTKLSVCDGSTRSAQAAKNRHWDSAQLDPLLVANVSEHLGNHTGQCDADMRLIHIPILNFANLPITPSRHAPIYASVAAYRTELQLLSIFGVSSTLLRQDLTSDNSSKQIKLQKVLPVGFSMHV